MSEKKRHRGFKETDIELAFDTDSEAEEEIGDPEREKALLQELGYAL